MAYIIRKLPKTGQTTSYVDYDDGYYEKGSPISPRFVDNGDGSITDRVTNLMWMKEPRLYVPSSIKASGIGVAKGERVKDTTYYAGDIVLSTPPWDLAYYFNQTWTFTWTTYADDTAYAVGDVVDDGAGNYYACFIAHTSDGATVEDDKISNEGSWGNSSASDPLEVISYLPDYPCTTGLGLAGSDGAGNIIDLKTTWGDAISRCHYVDFLGYSDWRLPNIKELMSIVDYERSNPAIDPLFTSESDFYWSSSTSAEFFWCYAWNVDFYSGYVMYDNKTNAYHVRPVRSIN